MRSKLYTTAVVLLTFGATLATCGILFGVQQHVSPASGSVWSLALSALVLGALLLFLELSTTPLPKEALHMNVWARQKHIMLISGQRVPNYPSITPTSLLYIALVMEELGELCSVSAPLIPAHRTDNSFARLRLQHAVKDTAGVLRHQSKALRTFIAQLEDDDFQAPIGRDDAVRVLDCTTDTMVTTAGLGLAFGMPNEEGYHEVQKSNESKADPVTGRILRDASGKWIKGSDFVPPNLHRLFDEVV